MRKLKQALTLPLALALSLALAVPAFADSLGSVYEDDYLGVTNVVELGEYDVYYGRMITCDAPAEVTLLNPIEYFDVYREMESGDWEKMSLSNFSTYVGHSGVTIIDAGAKVTLTEPGVYSVGIFGTNISDASKEPPVTDLNLGYQDQYQITVRAGSSEQPTQPTTPTVTVEDIPASGTAVASTQTVTVDGKAVEFQMYALVDENGNGTNYIKLRDMAQVLNGTAAQFSVGYDNASKLISVTTGGAYASTGTEMTTPFSGNRSYTGGAQTVQINGSAVDMTAITLLDDAGGGYNYFKLRDLGAALGFNVGYSSTQGVYIESDKPYLG